MTQQKARHGQKSTSTSRSSGTGHGSRHGSGKKKFSKKYSKARKARAGLAGLLLARASDLREELETTAKKRISKFLTEAKRLRRKLVGFSNAATARAKARATATLDREAELPSMPPVAEGLMEEDAGMASGLSVDHERRNPRRRGHEEIQDHAHHQSNSAEGERHHRASEAG